MKKQPPKKNGKHGVITLKVDAPFMDAMSGSPTGPH
jgi:hypothetical protein